MTISVAHVNVSRGFRGGERQTELLIDELAAKNVRQVLVARRDDALAGRCEAGKAELRPVSGSPVSVFRATRGVDIVHVHEGRSVYGAWLRNLVSGTPYVITRRVNNPIRRTPIARAAYRRAGKVAAVATDIARIVEAYDPVIATTVIHSGSSGFKVDRARSAGFRAAFDGKIVIGHVGALDNQQKGQQYIIEVARRVEQTQPALQFVLVGGGDDEAMLKAQAAGLSNLVFTGFVDNVGDYLAAFDLFILPSNKEGIGGILLDAMEQGLAVIASRVGGLPEIVRDGDNGLLIDPASPEQLEQAILSLANDESMRRAMGERGREFAKGYTAAVMAQKYYDIYCALVQAGAGESGAGQ